MTDSTNIHCHETDGGLYEQPRGAYLCLLWSFDRVLTRVEATGAVTGAFHMALPPTTYGWSRNRTVLTRSSSSAVPHCLFLGNRHFPRSLCNRGKELPSSRLTDQQSLISVSTRQPYIRFHHCVEDIFPPDPVLAYHSMAGRSPRRSGAVSWASPALCWLRPSQYAQMYSQASSARAFE